MLSIIILISSPTFTDEDIGPKILNEQKISKTNAKTRHPEFHHITQIFFF